MSTRLADHPIAGRRRAVAFAVLLALPTPSVSRAVEHPELCFEGSSADLDPAADVYAGGERPSRDAGGSVRSVLPYLADLVRLSGSGLLDVERAAFLVDQGGGRLRCELWPFDNGHRRTSYRGVVPGGTLAVAHTHPIDLPAPSENDRREAVRLGMTLFVASPWNVYEITAGGEVKALIRSRRWMERAGADGAVCGQADPSSERQTASREPLPELQVDRAGRDPYGVVDRFILGFGR